MSRCETFPPSAVCSGITYLFYKTNSIQSQGTFLWRKGGGGGRESITCSSFLLQKELKPTQICLQTLGLGYKVLFLRLVLIAVPGHVRIVNIRNGIFNHRKHIYIHKLSSSKVLPRHIIMPGNILLLPTKIKVI